MITLGCEVPALTATVQLAKPAGAEKVASAYWLVTITPVASASKSMWIGERTTTSTGSEAMPFATTSSVALPSSTVAGTSNGVLSTVLPVAIAHELRLKVRQ